MHRAFAALAFASAVSIGGRARALEVAVDPRESPPPSSTRSSGSHSRANEDWDDRDDLVVEGGAGAWLGLEADDGVARTLRLGVVASAGLHTMIEWRRSHHEKGDLPEVEGTRWCAPIACMGIGLLVAPPGVVLGNEAGADLRAVIAPPMDDTTTTMTRLSVRPFVRYARGAWRTQTFVGALLPELGVELDEARPPALAMAWSLYPLDLRVAGPVAVSLDPLRVGLVAREGAGVAADVGGELRIGVAP